jgi:hypothetical protein
MKYTVKTDKMPITTKARIVNEPSVNPTAADAGTKPVELCVIGFITS